MDARVRPAGWELRLSAVLREASMREFDPRHWNCARFVHACAQAVRGAELPFEWKGSLEQSADAVLERTEVKQALRGDVLLADVPHPTLGVCVGARAVFLAANGLQSVPRSTARVAWAV